MSVPPMAMLRRSRSARSPALPTAITMRPQLASSPAIAVFTRGELAMASAMRRAARALAAPPTFTVMNLRAPSPSRTTWQARSTSSASSWAGRQLREGVGGHDGAGRRRPAIGRGAGRQLVELGADALVGQRLADHPGRGDEDLAAAAAEALGERGGAALGRGPALAPGEGVGIAGIDQDGPRPAAGEMGTAELDRCRRGERAGEDAGDPRPGREL